MKNSFYNIEYRITTFGEISQIKGKEGKRVLVTSTNQYYFWKNNSWVLESAAAIGFTYYIGKLTQMGTSNPTVVASNSTMGNIIWERVSTGLYRGTLTGGFPIGTYFFHAGFIRSYLPVSPGGGTFIAQIVMERVDNDTVLIRQLDIDVFAPMDNFINFDFEIKVYA